MSDLMRFATTPHDPVTLVHTLEICRSLTFACTYMALLNPTQYWAVPGMDHMQLLHHPVDAFVLKAGQHLMDRSSFSLPIGSDSTDQATASGLVGLQSGSGRDFWEGGTSRAADTAAQRTSSALDSTNCGHPSSYGGTHSSSLHSGTTISHLPTQPPHRTTAPITPAHLSLPVPTHASIAAWLEALHGRDELHARSVVPPGHWARVLQGVGLRTWQVRQFKEALALYTRMMVGCAACACMCA